MVSISATRFGVMNPLPFEKGSKRPSRARAMPSRRHPWTTLGNGCLLEGMALSLEGRFEPFSKGSGFITPKRVAELETIAARHGIQLATLSNAVGPLERQFDSQT